MLKEERLMKGSAMKLLRVSTIGVLMSLLLVACAGNAPTAQETMDRMQAARENLRTAYTVVEVTLDAPERSGAFKVEAWAAKTGATDAASRPIGQLRAKVLNADDAALVGTEFVNDGRTFWLYNPHANTVITGSVSDLKRGDIGAQDPTAQLMRMQEMLQRVIDGSEVVIEEHDARVAGREAWQVRLTPKPETTQELQLGSQITTRLWIDKATDLPIKSVIDAGSLGRAEATATELELNEALPEGIFTFTPPTDADVSNAADIMRKARPQTMSLDDARAQVDFPLLSPSPLPADTQLEQVQVLALRGTTVIQNFGGALVFSLVQGRGDFPGDDRAPAGAETRTITVRGQPAILITGSGAEQGSLLRWEENGVTIVIAGALSPEQASAIAESLQ